MQHVFTKTGDYKTTSLFTGEIVFKHSLRVNAYGTLDEGMSHLGLARSYCTDASLSSQILWLQKELFKIMAELAQIGTNNNYTTTRQIKIVEKMILEYEKKLKPLKNFIIPGDSILSSLLHICRTVLRRAERETCGLAEEEYVNTNTLIFLNRASDLCFIFARFCTEGDIVSPRLSE